MRKLKKINGYLVVRFNDREKREYEGTGLGNFGVIDAELYTGILDVDRSVMEYDDAETLEIAMEQARGLEAELDVEEPEVKITVIIEGETEVSEEDVEPESLFRERKTLLETQLKSNRFADLDPRTAAHELYGYTRALEDLGMIDGHDERFMVEPDIFGATAPPTPPERREETLAYICDELCKHRIPGRTQEELDAICEKCRVDRWSGDPPAPMPEEVKRDTFKNAPSGIRNMSNVKKVYALGLMLAEECPDDDCHVYLNIFKMAREIDAALDKVGENTAPALVLRSALTERIGELWEMHENNYAVQKFREGARE